MRPPTIIDALADWLGRRFPSVYRVARPPWRFIMRLLSRPGYWERRKDYKYYREVIRLAKAYAPSGGQVIDVGAGETELLPQLEWFDRHVALDARYISPRAGVETIVMNFKDYQGESDFDLVLCLQVLEHLREPAPFARRLLETGRTVIISVPYRWPKGEVKAHLHDPVDEAKLELWTQRKPVETVIVADDGKNRLIAVYQHGDHHGSDEKRLSTTPPCRAGLVKLTSAGAFFASLYPTGKKIRPSHRRFRRVL